MRYSPEISESPLKYPLLGLNLLFLLVDHRLAEFHSEVRVRICSARVCVCATVMLTCSLWRCAA